MTNFPHSVKVEQPDRLDIIVIIDSYVLRPDFCMNISQNSIFSKKFQKIFKNFKKFQKIPKNFKKFQKNPKEF